MITFTLQGTVPSKKNAWRRTASGGVYLPDQIQADIDALVILAISQRNKLDVASLKGYTLGVEVKFEVKRQNRDLDNAFTTLLDVLQKAGIIENDRLVRAFKVEDTITAGEEKVTVTIKKLSTVERLQDARVNGKIKR